VNSAMRLQSPDVVIRFTSIFHLFNISPPGEMHSVSKHQDGSLKPHRCHITITTSSPTQTSHTYFEHSSYRMRGDSVFGRRLNQPWGHIQPLSTGMYTPSVIIPPPPPHRVPRLPDPPFHQSNTTMIEAKFGVGLYIVLYVYPSETTVTLIA
jgi:hypothetical protein